MNYTTVGQLSYIYPWYSYYYGNCHGQIGVCSLKFFSTTQPEKYNSQEIKNITIISHEIYMVTYFSIFFYLHNFVAQQVTLCVHTMPGGTSTSSALPVKRTNTTRSNSHSRVQNWWSLKLSIAKFCTIAKI